MSSEGGGKWVKGLREYVDASIYEYKRTKEIDNLLNDLLNPDEYKYGGNGNDETWFEKQYKLHQHLVAMEQETEDDYFKWLESAYEKAYSEGILSLDEYRKYQEEVYKGVKSLSGNDETWFEKQYKLHQHLLNMEQEDDKDYYECSRSISAFEYRLSVYPVQ